MLRTTFPLSLRHRLLNGSKAYGPILFSDSPIVAEVLATVGYDFLIVDQEHTPSTPQSTHHIFRAIDSMRNHYSQTNTTRDFPCGILTRLNSNTAEVTSVLDALQYDGGLLVPMVENAETARRVVERVRFPSSGGARGCAVPFVRATRYGSSMNYDEYQKQCAENVLLLVQVETLAGIEAIPDIGNVDGVDGIFLGPLDISSSIGKMGKFDDPEFVQTMERAESLVRECDSCLLTGFRVPGRSAKVMFEQGYSLVCSAVDLGLLRDAATRDCKEGRDAMHISDVSITK